jgi:hypothetical protein
MLKASRKCSVAQSFLRAVVLTIYFFGHHYFVMTIAQSVPALSSEIITLAVKGDDAQKDGGKDGEGGGSGDEGGGNNGNSGGDNSGSGGSDEGGSSGGDNSGSGSSDGSNDGGSESGSSGGGDNGSGSGNGNGSGDGSSGNGSSGNGDSGNGGSDNGGNSGNDGGSGSSGNDGSDSSGNSGSGDGNAGSGDSGPNNDDHGNSGNGGDGNNGNGSNENGGNDENQNSEDNSGKNPKQDERRYYVGTVSANDGSSLLAGGTKLVSASPWLEILGSGMWFEAYGDWQDDDTFVADEINVLASDDWAYFRGPALLLGEGEGEIEAWTRGEDLDSVRGTTEAASEDSVRVVAYFDGKTVRGLPQTLTPPTPTLSAGWIEFSGHFDGDGVVWEASRPFP